MGDLESFNQALVVKERQSNDELQEACKELIVGLIRRQVLNRQDVLGIDSRLGGGRDKSNDGEING
ncbi:hypothetical protein LguiB_012702 [Lonicera macranthoides]